MRSRRRKPHGRPRLPLFVLACLAGWIALLSGCNLVIGIDDYHASGTGGDTSTGTGGACDPADCPAPTSQCKKAVCADGACAEEDIQDGEPTATQSSGDCKRNVCLGGSPVEEDDDTDVEHDGTLCTNDSCVQGTPKHTAVMKGKACQDHGGRVCDGAGACVECNVDADCASDPEGDARCGSDHVCIPASCTDMLKNGDESDVDCGGLICDKCEDQAACGGASDCQSNHCDTGQCVHGTCGDGLLNNDQLGETDVDCGGSMCPACATDKACVLDGDCVGGRCTDKKCAPTCTDTAKNQDESDVDCGGTCPDCPNTKTCVSRADCVSNFCDANGKCAACTGNPDCDAGQFCTNGACKSDKALGEACGADAECMSAHCADGICCNSACLATCKACDLAGSVGSCTNVPLGQQDYFPDGACAGVNHCDGAGACKKGLGVACAGNGDCESGKCVDGVCCNSVCSTTCKACNVAGSEGTCTFLPVGKDDSNPACNGANTCNGAGLCKKANGQTCGAGSECASGNCVDGVCCNSSCAATCLSCKAVGLALPAGTCHPIIAGADPDNECSVSGKQECNGAGACGKGASGVYCQSGALGVCVNGDCPMQVFPATCP